MKGFAWFNTDNTVDICLIHGCYTKVVGCEPRDLGRVEINMKAMYLEVDKHGSSGRRRTTRKLLVMSVTAGFVFMVLFPHLSS